MRRLSLASAVGGLAGSVLLVLTSDSAFRVMVPVLLFVATALLATQDRLRSALRIGAPARSAREGGAGRLDRGDDSSARSGPADPRWLPVPVLVVSVYGGYFGAGLGIMLLAVLGIVLHEPLPRSTPSSRSWRW